MVSGIFGMLGQEEGDSENARQGARDASVGAKKELKNDLVSIFTF